MKVLCPHCQFAYDVSPMDIGKQFRCDKCQKTFVANASQGTGSLTERTEDKVNAFITRLTQDNQSGVALTNVYQKAAGLLTAHETIDYIALQKNILFNISPDALVITNRRVMLLTIGLFGSTHMWDILIRDIVDARISIGVFRATITLFSTSSNIVIPNILKTPAQRAYTILQEREERSAEERRQRKLEATRAAAGGIHLNSGTAGNGDTSQTGNFDDNIEKLEKLKKLLDSGIITPGEYEAKRQAILARL